VGAMLVEKWRFAPKLIETIRHQQPPNLKDTDMIACVFGANQICKKLNFGFGGNPRVEEFPESVQKRLGGSLDQVIEKLGDLKPLFEEAKLFAKL
jgi:HD-like signal output (HDOD) protein